VKADKKQVGGLRVQFWGVRGTIPTPGPGTVRLGGNTPCVEIRTSDENLIILDAGSGIRPLGISLREECKTGIEGTILISHTHWDHIQGFPFFAPLMSSNGQKNRFVVVGQKRVGQRLEKVLAGQIIEPYLPFEFQHLTADIDVQEVNDGECFQVGGCTRIQVSELRHPGGCLGFRIESGDSTFAYCTDSSHEDGRLTKGALELASGADLLVHDAQYTLAQRHKYKDRGHSSWLEAASVARQAEVGCLALFHYDPDTSDDEMEHILDEARKIFPRTILSREGLILDLPLPAEAPCLIDG
jgi:phosphoribosyl 1,2-cyclic phosphodiesterase